MDQTDRHAAVHPPPREMPATPTNVGDGERLASVVGGGLLALYGLSRLSVKGLLLAAAGGVLVHRGATGHCPVYDALGVDTAGAGARTRAVEAETTITVAAPRDEVYAFWRDFGRFPDFMEHIVKVHVMDERRSHWMAKAPGDAATITWNAEVVQDRPGEVVAWRSFGPSDVHNAGTVRFRDAPDGRTEVYVSIEYRPPAGDAGAAAARLLTPVFEQLVKEDVRRFKRLIEAGETPTTEGQPRGEPE